jgi:hypothetical protein
LRVPADQRSGVGLDDQVLVEAGVLVADLGVALVDQQPGAPPVWGLVGELEPDHHPAAGELFVDQVAGPTAPPRGPDRRR